MNSIKYRKLYLQENWGENAFIMVEETVNEPSLTDAFSYSVHFQVDHPKVSSGEGYWITHNKLCIGYNYRETPNIFRPIFSYKRQRLLDKVHYGNKKEEDKPDYSIINPKLAYARKKYLFGFVRKKKLPMDCVKIILSFIHSNL